MQTTTSRKTDTGVRRLADLAFEGPPHVRRDVFVLLVHQLQVQPGLQAVVVHELHRPRAMTRRQQRVLDRPLSHKADSASVVLVPMSILWAIQLTSACLRRPSRRPARLPRRLPSTRA